MARLIVKSPYFKGGGAKPAGGYLRYIATRERVEILPDDRPPTKRQTQLIEKLTKDFPDTKTLLEYGDYAAHPTKFNASQFLTLAMEENWSKVQEIDGYAKYIATRPRAERMGEHGLFGDEDAVDLNAAMAEVNSYTGNIWTHIISLRREDAERLGFDHADAWRALLRAHRNDIAEAMHIPPEDFRWYAAFHDEGGHPHVHMMAWSKKPGQAYLNREGIRKIKSVLTNQIFQQELLHIYEDKSQSRDELVRETRSAMLALAQKMQNSACEHPEAEQMIRELALELGQRQGKEVLRVSAEGSQAESRCHCRSDGAAAERGRMLRTLVEAAMQAERFLRGKRAAASAALAAEGIPADQKCGPSGGGTGAAKRDHVRRRRRRAGCGTECDL